MRSTFTEVAPGIRAWTDTCNAYVIKDGSAAILIDLGDGSVLDALPQLGGTQVDWVRSTHHHREQCQGHAKLAGHTISRGALKVAAPGSEQDLFEKPLSFRAEVPKLSDKFTVHGASSVRPPIEPITIDRAFE